MTNHAVLLAGLLLSGVLLVAPGCGDGDDTTTGSGGAGGQGGGGQGGSAQSSTGTGGSGGGASLTCDAYCDLITMGCTGANEQYPSRDSCMGACAGFPAGTAADMGGNTLGCRTYHASVADDSAMNMDTHCHHAGPSGGDGVCGDNCESFCAIAMTVCTGANEQWATNDACMTDCATFAFDPMNTYDTGDAMGDTYSCRLYHLTAASDTSNPMAASTHCGHIIAASPVCM